MKVRRAPQLIRDKALGTSRPGEPEVYAVEPRVHIALLMAKLHAEIEEVGRDLTNPEEYADVIEALSTLIAVVGVDPDEIERIGREKRERKGGFWAGAFWSPA